MQPTQYAIRYTIYDIRYTGYANRRNTPNSATTPNKPPVQPSLSTNYDLIMQNKANLLNAQMNVTTFQTKAYENISNCTLAENKPNTNPIQTQTNPISPPHATKQTQYKPNQTQFQTKLRFDESIAAGQPADLNERSVKRLVDCWNIFIYYAWKYRIILKRTAMAKITFNLEEIIKILISNRLLPPEVIRIRVKAERIHFVIKTNTFILPFIPASLKYLSFDDNNAIFELSIVGGRLSKATRWINQMLKLKIPAYMKLDYPKMFVDIEKLLQENNIRGVRVKEISFEGGEFTIETCNI